MPRRPIDVYGAVPGVEPQCVRLARRVHGDRGRRSRQVVEHLLGPVRANHPEGQPGLQQAENLLFEQAAAQGQTMFAAAGDNGSR